MTQPNIKIREASPEEDSLIAEHFYHLWRDNDVPAESIRSNWHDITIQFISNARRDLFYKAFVAEINHTVVGSASCQIFTGLYPNVLEDHYRKYGYIWGVYVEFPHRNQGIAKKLILTMVDYLKSIGCTRVILHATPLGKPVYKNIGFFESTEMRLDIS
jgi:GNAT superfamily N-acetyltransferase